MYHDQVMINQEELCLKLYPYTYEHVGGKSQSKCHKICWLHRMHAGIVCTYAHDKPILASTVARKCPVYIYHGHPFEDKWYITTYHIVCCACNETKSLLTMNPCPPNAQPPLWFMIVPECTGHEKILPKHWWQWHFLFDQCTEFYSIC